MSVPIKAMVFVALIIGSMGTLIQAKDFNMNPMIAADGELVKTNPQPQPLPVQEIEADYQEPGITGDDGIAVSSPIMDYDFVATEPIDIEPMEPVVATTPAPEPVEIDFENEEVKKNLIKKLKKAKPDKLDVKTTRIMTGNYGKNLVIMEIDSEGKFRANHYYILEGGKIKNGAMNAWGEVKGDVFYGFVGETPEYKNFFWGRFQNGYWMVQNFHGGLMRGEFNDFPA